MPVADVVEKRGSVVCEMQSLSCEHDRCLTGQVIPCFVELEGTFGVQVKPAIGLCSEPDQYSSYRHNLPL